MGGVVDASFWEIVGGAGGVGWMDGLMDGWDRG